MANPVFSKGAQNRLVQEGVGGVVVVSVQRSEDRLFGPTVASLAEEVEESSQSINELSRGSPAVSIEMARRLSRLFGDSPEFWLNATRRSISGTHLRRSARKWRVSGRCTSPEVTMPAAPTRHGAAS